MTASEWQQVRELFEAALDEAPASPQQWLEARAVDSAVRREVNGQGSPGVY